MSGAQPEGVRASATESWGRFRVNLVNRDEVDRQAGVFVHYEGQDNLQYGRTAWAPAQSQIATWLLVGPAAPQDREQTRDIRSLLYDRSKGNDVLVLPPGEERVRPRGISYAKRAPYTVIFLDEMMPEGSTLGRPPPLDSLDDESIQLARGIRYVLKLSEVIPIIGPGALSPVPEAYDGIDHFIVASDQIARDLPGMRGLRQWVEQGGKLWVMLDRVDPEGLAPLLGTTLDFQAVERTRLTRFAIDTYPPMPGMVEPTPQVHERPVTFTRVLLPPGERPRYTVQDWPVWFARPLGRGRVVFSTLGPRAWFRARKQAGSGRDRASPFQSYPSFPIPLAPLEDLTLQLRTEARDEGFQVASLQPMLTEEIGYQVMERSRVALIFGGFLLAALTLGMALRWSRRPEWLGWLGPGAALAAAGVFLVLGQASHRATPSTLAVTQVIDAVSGEKEAALHGLLAVYRPDSGPLEAGATEGGLFQLDMTGSEGQIRRLVRTDLDAWHWENLTVPVGVRVASFRCTVPTDRPLEAVAHFGPDGLEGRLSGPVEEAADALLHVPGGRTLAVTVRPDGTFRAAAGDVLPKGQLLAGTVLSDRQQRRQEVYRDLLGRSTWASKSTVLMAWGRPLDMHFRIGPVARTTGSALFVVPLRLEQAAAGQRVTIPAPFVSYQRLLQDVTSRATLESSEKADMHLRFQLPAEVLPFQIERARLALRIEAPGRQVTIAAREGKQFVAVRQLDSPLDPIHVEITEPRLLHTDEQGGLHLSLNIGALQAGSQGPGLGEPATKWTIDYVELEVSGKTQEKDEK